AARGHRPDRPRWAGRREWGGSVLAIDPTRATRPDVPLARAAVRGARLRVGGGGLADGVVEAVGRLGWRRRGLTRAPVVVAARRAERQGAPYSDENAQLGSILISRPSSVSVAHTYPKPVVMP